MDDNDVFLSRFLVHWHLPAADRAAQRRAPLTILFAVTAQTSRWRTRFWLVGSMFFIRQFAFVYWVAPRTGKCLLLLRQRSLLHFPPLYLFMDLWFPCFSPLFAPWRAVFFFPTLNSSLTTEPAIQCLLPSLLAQGGDMRDLLWGIDSGGRKRAVYGGGGRERRAPAFTGLRIGRFRLIALMAFAPHSTRTCGVTPHHHHQLLPVL